jgi:hypothetical protein
MEKPASDAERFYFIVHQSLRDAPAVRLTRYLVLPSVAAAWRRAM